MKRKVILGIYCLSISLMIGSGFIYANIHKLTVKNIRAEQLISEILLVQQQNIQTRKEYEQQLSSYRETIEILQQN